MRHTWAMRIPRRSYRQKFLQSYRKANSTGDEFMKQTSSVVYDRAHPEVWKIFGAVVNAPMQDCVRVTVVAAGLPTPTLC